MVRTDQCVLQYLELKKSKAAKDLSKVNCSTPTGISDKLHSSDHLLVTSRNRPSRKVGDSMHDGSLPEIIMEQEELSDSEEELGENVEFEEMADSEGENTPDSEPSVNTSNEEMLADGMDETINDDHVINYEGNCVDACTTDNMKPSVVALNLNSRRPPVSPHPNPCNAVAEYDFGPFGEIQAPLYSKRPETHLKSESSFVQKHAMNARQHTTPGCARRMTSDVGITASGPGQPKVDMNVEKSENGDKDEFS